MFILVVKHVIVNCKMIEWFVIEVVVRQECVMSPCLFKVFIDGVLREGKVVGL